MTHPIHDPTVQIINEAIILMDQFMRDQIDLDVYGRKLRAFDVDSLLEEYQEDFRKDARLVYYLDTLMVLSSLQQELDFQVAEYGYSIARSWMTACAEARMWTMIQPSSGGFCHFPNDDLKIYEVLSIRSTGNELLEIPGNNDTDDTSFGTWFELLGGTDYAPYDKQPTEDAPQ